MNQQFDELFAGKVRDSFSELEVEFSEAHWQQFLAKEKSAAMVIPLFYKKVLSYAAVLIITIGVVFIFNRVVSDSEIESPVPDKEQMANNKEPNQNLAPGIADDKTRKKPNEEELGTKNLADIASVDTVTNREKNSETENASTDKKESIRSVASINYIAVNQMRFNTNPRKSILGNEMSGDGLTQVADVYSAETTFFIPESSEKRVNTIELHASSLTNYSEVDPASSLNYSGGISSEVQLTNRFGFSSGFTIAKQGLEIKNSGREVTSESELGETSTNIFADLVTLDVPLNIRYYLKENKESYFSFGVSSFLYLRESFITSTRVVREDTIERDGEEIINRNVDEFSNSRSEDAFSRFDFAKTVNLSFGFEHTLSNKLGIIFEPYAKIPIAPLTSEQVRFGSGGLHVRFQFRN